jgi:hypothetical protein
MKLEWQEDIPQKRMTWYEAIEYAKSLGDGWRLPTRGELCDAYDSFVDGFKKNNYWSSSTLAQSTNHAWNVDFNNGLVNYDDKSDYYYYVRCVREIGEC